MINVVLTHSFFRHIKSKRLMYEGDIALKPIVHLFLHSGASLTGRGSRRDVYGMIRTPGVF